MSRYDRWTRYCGEKVRSLRESACISRKELAFRCGVPEERIAELEGGSKSPSFLFRSKIASALQRSESVFSTIEAGIA